MVNRYIEGIDAVVGMSRLRHRASVVGEALSPTPSSSSLALAAYPNEVRDGVQTLVGAVLGGTLWHKHRVLGMIAGASLGTNVPALASSETRRDAACNLAQTHAGVLLALALDRSNVSPLMRFIGFGVGYVGVGAALYRSGLRKAVP